MYNLWHYHLSLKKEESWYDLIQYKAGGSYMGMGRKGTVTPLLKGKVWIPPPSEHFIGPPCPEIFFTLPLSQENFSHTASKKHKKIVLKNSKITHILTNFQSSLEKWICRAIFEILQYPPPPRPRWSKKCFPPLQEKSVRIPPPGFPIFYSPPAAHHRAQVLYVEGEL